MQSTIAVFACYEAILTAVSEACDLPPALNDKQQGAPQGSASSRLLIFVGDVGRAFSGMAKIQASAERTMNAERMQLFTVRIVHRAGSSANLELLNWMARATWNRP